GAGVSPARRRGRPRVRDVAVRAGTGPLTTRVPCPPLSRRLLPFLLLLACLAVPVAGQAASYETGISDQVPSSFLNPLFQPLGLSAARYITPYDVMNLPAGSPDRVALSQWVRNAGGQDLLVSFEHSHTRGPSPLHDRRAPHPRPEQGRAVGGLRQAVPALRAAVPGGLGHPQLLGHQPVLDPAHPRAAQGDAPRPGVADRDGRHRQVREV